VAFRRRGSQVDVALISVGSPARWQLPKGLVDSGERPEAAAMREVREEAGVSTRFVAPLERIEYWYQRSDGAERIRVHKFVHFFLLEYVSGDVADHDEEVVETRWIDIREAEQVLAFASERKVVASAAAELRQAALPTRV
jgi:8-oxo-dGTP pyrophosphatase MutT (NUDIX family)